MKTLIFAGAFAAALVLGVTSPAVACDEEHADIYEDACDDCDDAYGYDEYDDDTAAGVEVGNRGILVGAGNAGVSVGRGGIQVGAGDAGVSLGPLGVFVGAGR
jgi:hypothetical protein